MANRRRRDGARPNNWWLVWSMATVKRTAASPAMTPTEVTTSLITCRPSALSAGERSSRPARSNSSAKTALMAAATPFTARPAQGADRSAGAFQARATSARISKAATTISTPSSTAEKYSAL